MSIAVTINGKTLPGDVDVKGWGIDGTSKWNILKRQSPVDSNYTVTQKALDFSQVEPASVGVVIKTFVSDEISTEETMKKLVAYCFQYLDQVGKLTVGSETVAEYAVLTKVSPWVDHKRGYGISYNFTVIDKSDGLRWVKPLKNPSFEAYDDTNKIQYWEQIKESAGCICEHSQLFGDEPLGAGQYCVKTYSVMSGQRARIKQDLTFISGAAYADIEDLYLKFSIDCMWQNNDTTQNYGDVHLAFTNGTGYYSSTTLRLYNNRPSRLSIMASYGLFYNSSLIDGLQATNLTTAGTIYFDRAKLKEITL